MAPSFSTSGGSSWWNHWWSSLTTFSSPTTRKLGRIWQNNDAIQAFQDKSLVSCGGNSSSLRVCFRNYTPISLVLCWISESGKPHHFYTLKPTLQNSIEVVTSKDHVESTKVGHAFCIARDCSEADIQRGYLDPSNVIGGYRPETISRKGDVHVVTIMCTQQQQTREAIPSCCCPSWHSLLRGTHRHKKKDDDNETSDDDSNDYHFTLEVTRGVVDPTPLDTSTKRYTKTTIGGWPCMVQDEWHGGNKQLQTRLENDLQQATQYLPPHARSYLKTNTPIYINASQQYGSQACPTNGKGLCFHPHEAWLQQNGMSCAKCQCIELYNAKDYLEDCQQWGPGGVLLHELCHAFHFKYCQDGYDNDEIRKCYQQAMKDGIYDSVAVKTRRGDKKKQRAYACTDQMEYFAELSTAFLGGLDSSRDYNKWFPFNRLQLEKHDPRAYQLLQKVWGVKCDDEGNGENGGAME